MKTKSYRKIIIFISLSFISLGLFLIIGLFNQPFYTLDVVFSRFLQSPTNQIETSPDKLSSQVQDTFGRIKSLIDIQGDITLISFLGLLVWALSCGTAYIINTSSKT